ncbi:MAG: rRNA maturation RNase YbeY [Planctomycetales bacterium]
MFQIEIANQQDIVDVDEEFLLKVAQTLLTAEGVREAEISIALLDDPEIWKINKEFLDHDYPADVLSFLLEEEELEEAPEDAPRGFGMSLNGEILIGAEEAVRGGTRYGWSTHNEMTLYLVHGLLHLCGYDDQDDEERAIMREREKFHLAAHGIVPQYTERDLSPDPTLHPPGGSG